MAIQIEVLPEQLSISAAWCSAPSFSLPVSQLHVGHRQSRRVSCGGCYFDVEYALRGFR